MSNLYRRKGHKPAGRVGRRWRRMLKPEFPRPDLMAGLEGPMGSDKLIWHKPRGEYSISFDLGRSFS